MGILQAYPKQHKEDLTFYRFENGVRQDISDTTVRAAVFHTKGMQVLGELSGEQFDLKAIVETRFIRALDLKTKDYVSRSSEPVKALVIQKINTQPDATVLFLNYYEDFVA